MENGDVRYIGWRECLDAIRSSINELTQYVDPAPWYVSGLGALPGDNETPNIRPMAESARANATFFRAMLTGSLHGWFVDDNERFQIPGWAWADVGGDWRALLPERRFFHALLPDHFQRWAHFQAQVERAEWDAWLASSELEDQRGFPSLPPAHDEASRPPLITSKALPDRPTVGLSEAVSWLALGISLDRRRLNAAMNQNAFGKDLAAIHEGLQNAVNRLTEAATGGLAMHGKLVRGGDEPKSVLTEVIPPERFHDFRWFDVTIDGLWQGNGIRWERTDADAYVLASSKLGIHLRDVKVSRVGLMSICGDMPTCTLRSVGSGRRKGDGSMAAADAPLLDKMRELIVGGKAFSPHGAALKVADKASGNGTVESKATRLSRRYRQLENNGAQ